MRSPSAVYDSLLIYMDWTCFICGEHITRHKESCVERDLDRFDRYVAILRCPHESCHGKMEENINHDYQCYDCGRVYSDKPTVETLRSNDPIVFYVISDVFGGKHKLVETSAPYTQTLREFYFERLTDEIEKIHQSKFPTIEG